MVKAPALESWRLEYFREALARIEALRDDLIKRMISWLLLGNGAGLIFTATVLASSETRMALYRPLVVSGWFFAFGMISAFIFAFLNIEMVLKASTQANRAILSVEGAEDAPPGPPSHLETQVEKEVRELGISALAAATLFILGVVNALLAATPSP